MSAILTGLAMAAPSIIKGVSRAINKPPEMKTSNETTAYLNKLRNVSKTGLYGEDVKSDVMADIKQSDQDTRTAIRGQAVQQGIENSGVLAQQLIKQGGQTTLNAARIAKKIAQMNEKSKLDASQAAMAVGQGIQDRNYQNALAKYENTMGMIGDFTDAFSSGYGGYKDFKKKAILDEDEELSDALT